MLRSRDHKRFFGWVWIVWSCSAAQDENRNIWNGFNMGTSMWMGLREPYRHFRHPDRFGLLVADLVLQSLVPMVGAGLQINTCWRWGKRRAQSTVRRTQMEREKAVCWKLLCVRSALRERRYQRRGGCSVSSVWGPVCRGAWSSCWSLCCTSASLTSRPCDCGGPRTEP